MAVFVLEDLEASIEVTVFPRTLVEQGHKLEDDRIVSVKGRLDKRDESRFGLIAQFVDVLSGLSDGPAPPMRLMLPNQGPPSPLLGISVPLRVSTRRRCARECLSAMSKMRS